MPQRLKEPGARRRTPGPAATFATAGRRGRGARILRAWRRFARPIVEPALRVEDVSASAPAATAPPKAEALRQPLDVAREQRGFHRLQPPRPSSPFLPGRG